MSRLYDALKKLEEERGRKSTEVRERPMDVLATRISVAQLPVPMAPPVASTVPPHRRSVSGWTATALGLVALATVWTGWESTVARDPIQTSRAPVTGALVAEGTAAVLPREAAGTVTPRQEDPRPAMPAPVIPGETTSTGPQAVRPASSASRGLVQQVGAFVRAENAEALRRRLAGQYPDVYVSVVERNGQAYHRVRIGGLASEGERRAIASALRSAGYAPTAVRE